MAATLKLGNENWAAKEGSLLAYNDENDNFKPLPFDFTRASSSTYVASDGLIKTSTTGQPRIDFLDNTNGALLLEPQRTNVLTYSEDFSQSFWAKSSVTLTTGFVSPDGTTNASKLVSTGADGSMQNSYTVSSGTTYTISVYLKTVSGTLDTTIGLGSPGFPQNEGTGGRYKNITVTNEWKRYSLTSTADASAVTGVGFGGFSGFSTGEEVLIWGIQLEESAYPTSYIPTSGSTVTRVSEVCDNGGNNQVINSTEGVLFADIEFLTFTGGDYLGLNDGSNTQRVLIERSGTSLRGNINSIQLTSTLSSLNNKLAIKWKLNDFQMYLNGVKVSEITSGGVPSGLDRLEFEIGGGLGLFFYGKVKQLQVYKTALSNSELATLTTI